MAEKYNAVLAFNLEFNCVWLVEKNTPSLPHIHRRWNGIGGKMNAGESPVGGAMREFAEETGIALPADRLVLIEHQRFLPGHEIYWYASVLWPDEGKRVCILNDAGEFMNVHRIDTLGRIALAPNVSWLVHKGRSYIRQPYLERAY